MIETDNYTVERAARDRMQRIAGWQYLVKYAGLSAEWMDRVLGALAHAALGAARVADYGPYRGGGDEPGPDETTCRHCGRLAIEHGGEAWSECPAQRGGEAVDREALAEALALSLWDEGIIRPESLAREAVDHILAYPLLAARGDAAPGEVGHVEEVQSVGITGEGDGAEPGATRITVIVEGPCSRFALGDLVTVSAWREVS